LKNTALIILLFFLFCTRTWAQPPAANCLDPKVISANQTSFCLNETIILSTPAIDGATYAWTGPNAFTASQQTVNIPVTHYNLAGNYSLTVTVNGCTSDPSSITIPTIRQTPVITLDVTENNVCTPQLSYTISYTASNYQELRANFGAGARIRSGTGNGPYTVTYNNPGRRTILLTARALSECTVSLSKVIDVPAIPSKPIIGINETNFCLNDIITLSTPQQPGTTYLWQGPNNFSSDQASVSIPVNSFNLAGRYTLIATLGRCSSEEASIIIPEILKIPVAAFSSNPPMPAKVSASTRVRFINNSTDATTYLWNFGDGTTSTEENPEHEYSALGEYNVTLTAFNQACSASVVKGRFVIKADNRIFIPNTFTPNGDGINDEFVVTIINLKQYRLQIFNRFGTRLFLANDIFDNWKGIHNNETLPAGTYYYIIDAVDLNDEAIKQSGAITIIR
jgi:gliding motility-associated-like protein